MTTKLRAQLDAALAPCATCDGTGCTHDGCPDQCGACPTCHGDRGGPIQLVVSRDDADRIRYLLSLETQRIAALEAGVNAKARLEAVVAALDDAVAWLACDPAVMDPESGAPAILAAGRAALAKARGA